MIRHGHNQFIILDRKGVAPPFAGLMRTVSPTVGDVPANGIDFGKFFLESFIGCNSRCTRNSEHNKQQAISSENHAIAPARI
jgi:hypothetical protein